MKIVVPSYRVSTFDLTMEVVAAWFDSEGGSSRVSGTPVSFPPTLFFFHFK